MRCCGECVAVGARGSADWPLTLATGTGAGTGAGREMEMKMEMETRVRTGVRCFAVVALQPAVARVRCGNGAKGDAWEVGWRDGGWGIWDMGTVRRVWVGRRFGQSVASVESVWRA